MVSYPEREKWITRAQSQVMATTGSMAGWGSNLGILAFPFRLVRAWYYPAANYGHPALLRMRNPAALGPPSIQCFQSLERCVYPCLSSRITAALCLSMCDTHGNGGQLEKISWPLPWPSVATSGSVSRGRGRAGLL